MKNIKALNFLLPLTLALILACSNQQTKEEEEVNVTDTNTPAEKKLNSPPPTPQGTIKINSAEFREKIFDYRTQREWNLKSDKPCIIDFYADWCPPCRIISPILEELAKEYEGKIYIYKVNVDYERELAQVFGIQSLPTLLFCPLNDKPVAQVGAYSKEEYKNFINSILLK